MEALLPLKEFVEVLADLKIYSTGDFISLKRKGDIPDGITDRPLQVYPELKGEWSHLWDRVHTVRLTGGENPRERQSSSVKEVAGFIQGVVDELDEHELGGEDISEEEFPEGIEDGSQKESGEEGESVKSYRGQTEGKKSGRNEVPVGESSSISQKVADPSHRDFQEERKRQLLELIAENNRITIDEMVTAMGLSRYKINKVITVLKREGRLARIGTIGGYWQILQEGDQPDDPLEENKKKILELIAKDEEVTAVEIAEETGLSRYAVDNVITVLKREGRLARIGTIGGYWKILQERDKPDDPLKERKKKILELIGEDAEITIDKMAEKMNLSRAPVDRMIAGLKREGHLARIGTKNGYWKILQEGDR